MSDRMYFLSTLAAAIHGDGGGDRQQCTAALEQIRRLSADPAFAAGYEQFLRFIAEVNAAVDRRRDRAEVQLDLLLERLAHEAHDAAGPAEMSPDDLHERLQEWITPTPSPTWLILSRDGHTLKRWCIDTPGVVSAVIAEEGVYELALEGGRLLWAEPLSRAHLRLADAFPDRPLEMAADTGDEPRPTPASLERELCDNAMRLRVVPGLEAGLIEVHIREQQGADR